MARKPFPRWSFQAALVVAAAWAAVAAPAPAADSAFVLDLPGGGRLPGEFAPAEATAEPRQTLPWRAPQFTAPLEFQIDEIVGIRSTATAAVAPADADVFSCRLRGGDTIDGRLQEIDATKVVLAVPDGGPLTIARDVVTGLGRRTVAAAAGYVGPGGLAGWEQSPDDSWRDEAGRIVSERPNATVNRDVAAPARARYDIVLSWRKQPEFVLAVAAGDGKNVDPFRLEMLSTTGKDPVLVLVRHEQTAGMLEPVRLPPEERGRVRFSLFVDQAAGRLAVVVGGGERPVEITVAPPEGRAPSPRFRLQIRSGDICLERIRVAEWKSAEPRVGNPDTTQVGFRDGTEVEGEIVSLDAAGKLVVRAADGEQTRRLNDLESVSFAAADEDAERPAGEAAAGPRVRVVRRGGGVLTGQIVAVADDGLVMARSGLDRAVTVPFADLHSLVSLAAADPRPLPGRIGTLKLKDAELAGCLVDAVAWGGGLAWQPRGSVVASPLAPIGGEVAAVVEYVAAPPAIVEEAGGAVEVGGIGASVNQDEEGFFVVTMLSEEGAAARDGRIEPGDRIVAVQPIKDGPFVPTKGLELQAVMNLMRGRVGSPVGLQVEKPGAAGQPRGMNLVRGLIYVAERAVLDQALAEHARVVAGQAGAGDQAGRFPSLLVLRSGDVVPVAVDRIDAQGVRLRSPVTAGAGEEVVTVATGLVRAIELDPAAGSSKISPDRFQRLTTLPRSQRDDPPTHLLRLRTQDYLRGRLESLDDDEVVFSVLDQRKRLPRAAVSRIIWLHPEEIDFAAGGAAPPERDPEDAAEGGEKPPAEDNAPAGLLVQGVSPQGRATLVAERMEGTAIIGTSPSFGPSRIDTTRIDKLLIGGAVGTGDEQLPFAQWRLRLAPLPRALRDEE